MSTRNTKLVLVVFCSNSVTFQFPSLSTVFQTSRSVRYNMDSTNIHCPVVPLDFLALPFRVFSQSAGGITAAQLGKSAAGLSGRSPLKIVEEGIPRAIALAQLEQVRFCVGTQTSSAC